MRLRWLDRTSRPVIVRDLEPLKLLGLSVGDVLRQQVWIGNQTANLGELFEVSDKDEGTLTLEGDLRHVQGIGKDMAGGTLVVRGDAGAFLGTGMSSGAIHVHGSVTDYAGAEIRGGFLEIHGSAGYGLGAALAFVSTPVALAVFAAVPLLYIIPSVQRAWLGRFGL